MKDKKILILTSQFDKSVDGVVDIVSKAGVQIDRFNSDTIPVNSNLSFEFKNGVFKGYYSSYGKTISLDDYTSFWYRHPGKPIPHKILKPREKDFVKEEASLASEGFWMALEGSAFWLSKPSNIALSRYRLKQLATAQRVGFKIPQTLVSNKKEDVLAFFNNLKEGIIAKAVGVGIPLKHKEGYNYYQVIFTKKLTLKELKQNLETIKFCPSIFQEFIKKDIELRVTVVGKKVFTCAILSQKHSDPNVKVDWRRVSPDEIVHQAYALPKLIENKCVAIVKELGLVYGAIDIIKNDKGEYVFLEINSDGQYSWIQQLTGLKIDDAVARLLINNK